MEKMKRTAIGRLGSWLLAIAMVVTSFTIPNTVVLAEEPDADPNWVETSLITGGDFESNISDWTVTGPELNDGYSFSEIQTNSDSYNNNKTVLWQLNNDTVSENTTSLKHQDIQLPAGTYKLVLEQEGDGFASGLTVKVGTLVSKELPATTGWNQWVKVETDSFQVEEETTVTVEFTGAMSAKYWGRIDNIVLMQWQEAEESIVDKTQLQSLVASVPEDYQSMGFTATTEAALTEALTNAQTCLFNSEATEADITTCHNALKSALEALVLWSEDVFVEKISTISDNSIRGMDISSYLSIMETFDALNEKYHTDTYGFKDYNGTVLTKQGFFDFLAAAGVNYVRLRVWNDPYTAQEQGYGGGNNDLAKAVVMGKYATNAQMNVLIDFHYSDFWADPSKQVEPKAWKSMTLEEKTTALAAYTKDSLETLLEEGVNVTMVQVGNETNGAFCGEKTWNNMNQLFDAGCDAVHEAAEKYHTEILAALHFTNPETDGRQMEYADNLNAGDVSYDVFATSYYPYWHGSLSNLSSVLSAIAQKYDKYVMVAETSYANTLEDTDGHENTVRKGNNDTVQNCIWPFTIQGQTREFRDVLDTVTAIDVTLTNGDQAGLGAFYWEGAWITVQNPYGDAGTVSQNKLEENKELWEAYGSGWASSYAAEYDAEDAGKWYGGSAVDNQAFFGADGTALKSLAVFDFKNLKYGTETTVKADGYSVQEVTMQVGEDVADYLGTATILNNDASKAENQRVNWSETDISNVNTKTATNSGIGTYTVTGVLESDPNFEVECIVNVEAQNLLHNGDFEAGSTSWTISDTETAKVDGTDVRGGSYGCHFWSASEVAFSVSQKITINTPGIYKGAVYLQGGAANAAEAYLEIKVGKTSVSGNTVSGNTLSGNTVSEHTATGDTVKVEGWNIWKQASADHVVITSDMIAKGQNVVTYTIYVTGEASSWGTLDDAIFYLDEDSIKLPQEITIKEANLSITEGNEKQLTVQYQPTDTNVKDLTWESSNEAVVTVDETGCITALKAGKAVVKATSLYDQSVSANCAVTVTAKAVAPSPQPVTPPQDTPKEEATTMPKEVGTILRSSHGSYQVTVSETGAAEVAFKAAASKKEKKVTVPDTVEIDGVIYRVTSIANNAFKNNKKLTTVKLGNNITAIGKSAFQGCTALKKITIPQNVTTIGAKAFSGAKNLKTITIKSSVLKKVGSSAFKGIKSNATIKVPAKKLKAYKKLLKKKGQKATVKIKK